MSFSALLPFYSEIKVGGLLACSYSAGIVSTIAVFLFSRLCLKKTFAFERIATFCFLASGLMWIFPILPIFEKDLSDLELFAVLLLLFPIAKILYKIPFKDALSIWLPFAIVQISIYFYIVECL